MKLFRRLSALTMVLALLLSLSISVFAVDVANIDELRGALSNTEDTDVNLTGDIYTDGYSVEANGGSYTIGGSGSLNGVNFGGSGEVVINTEVNGLGAQDSVDVTVNGDVNGGLIVVGTDEEGNPIGGIAGVLATGNASVTVNGDVNGSDGDPDVVDYDDPHDFSDGGIGIVASGEATVAVSGNVTGGDAYGTYGYAGTGIETIGNVSVSVGGNVSGGSVTTDPDTIAEEGCMSRAGTAIVMTNSSTVSVGGNVSGGSTNGDAGIGGSGVVIHPYSEEAGSLTVGGDVTSGSAENGTDGVGLYVYSGDFEGIDDSLPEITVGSYDSIGGDYLIQDGPIREMTDGELNAVKSKIKTTSAGENKQVADNFWPNLIAKIRKAQPGDEITVNVYSRMSIPAAVIEAVREYDVKLIIQWAGGDDLVITKDFTAEVKGTILLKDLAEMLKK